MNKRARVVSISLPPELLAAIDRLQERPGFTGRSEVVRAGVQSLIQRLEGQPAPKKSAHATLTLGYDAEVAPRVTKLRHVFDDVIRTLMHTHREDGSCLEVLLLAGPTERIQALQETLLGREGVQTAEVVWVRGQSATGEGGGQGPAASTL